MKFEEEVKGMRNEELVDDLCYKWEDYKTNYPWPDLEKEINLIKQEILRRIEGHVSNSQ